MIQINKEWRFFFLFKSFVENKIWNVLLQKKDVTNFT